MPYCIVHACDGSFSKDRFNIRKLLLLDLGARGTCSLAHRKPVCVFLAVFGAFGLEKRAARSEHLDWKSVQQGLNKRHHQGAWRLSILHVVQVCWCIFFVIGNRSNTRNVPLRTERLEISCSRMSRVLEDLAGILRCKDRKG